MIVSTCADIHRVVSATADESLGELQAEIDVRLLTLLDGSRSGGEEEEDTPRPHTSDADAREHDHRLRESTIGEMTPSSPTGHSPASAAARASSSANCMGSGSGQRVIGCKR